MAAQAQPAQAQPALASTPGSKHDRILGMLYGHAVAEALGMPHEFKRVKLAKYTGLLVHPTILYRRFKGCVRYAPGINGDDFEMLMALAWSIMRSTGYSRDRAATEYLDWANSACPFMGTNTRALFRGVTTLAGYEKRRAAKAAEPEAAQSQSNGFLMRAAPLAVLPDWESAAAADCALSNFPPVCLDASRVYVGALHDALEGLPRDVIFERAMERARTQEVTDVLMQVADGVARDVTGQIGWCLHALYAAFWALNQHRGSYQDTIDGVIRLGGDADTNGAISGALIGAGVGAYLMQREARTAANLKTIMATAEGGASQSSSTGSRQVTTGPGSFAPYDRPGCYRATKLPQIATGLAAIAAVLEKKAAAANDARAPALLRDREWPPLPRAAAGAAASGSTVASASAKPSAAPV